MIRPVRVNYASPEIVYAEFSKAATGAVANVRDFTSLMRDPMSQDIHAKAKESESQNSDGIMDWLVSQHADWMDEPEVTEDDRKIKDEIEADKRPKGVGEGVEQDVETFKKMHPKVEVKLEANKQSIRVCLHKDMTELF